jgi:hypothetical protein
MVYMKVKQITAVPHIQMWQAIRAEVTNKPLPSHEVTSQISPILRKSTYVDEGLQVSLTTRSIHPLLGTEQTGDKVNFLQHFYIEVVERKLTKQSEATRNYKLIQRYSFEEKNNYRRSWKLKLALSVGRNLIIHKTAFGLRVTATMVA